MNKLILVLIILCLVTRSSAQDFSDKKSIMLSSDGLQSVHILNHRGAVSVSAVSGNEVSVEVSRTLKSASRERLDRAIEEIFIDTMILDGHLYFFIQDPDRVFQISPEGQGEYRTRDWDFKSNQERFRVKKRFDLTVNLPAHLDVEVANHEHPLQVKGITGKIMARNHHDGVSIEGAGDDVRAASHHGDVSISFRQNPSSQVAAKTHHGDIEIVVQPGLSADVMLKSRHGSFYTDFDWVPVPIHAVNKETSKGTKYSYGNGTRVKIGDSGNAIDMELKTYHGDIVITGGKNN